MLNSLAQALNLSADVLLDQAGLLHNLRHGDSAAGKTAGPDPSPAGATEAAIRADERLTAAQKRALLSVYESYISANPAKNTK